MKFVFIISTGGSVFKSLFKNNDNWIEYIHSVVSDRECEAVTFAKGKGISTEILYTADGSEFSEKLHKKFINEDQLIFISFYTKLFTGRFVRGNFGKIINFHPSILPACAGRDGFGDTLRAGGCFIGSTVHYVDEGMDTGKPIMQAALPYNPNLSVAENRHKVFKQQCKMLEQVMRWFIQNRITFEKERVEVIDAKYHASEFSPNIEI